MTLTNDQILAKLNLLAVATGTDITLPEEAEAALKEEEKAQKAQEKKEVAAA